MTAGSSVTENPRTDPQKGIVLILAMRQRQAPDDPIGLRYPIRAYQPGPSSSVPASPFPFFTAIGNEKTRNKIGKR